MSQQNVYSIQLLNDLHNHFPEILYNPGRFQNIQDLLLYIRNVADDSPYMRGYTEYARHINRQTQINLPNTVPRFTVPLQSVPLQSVPLQSVPLQSVPLQSVPIQTTVRTTTIPTRQTNNINSLLSNNQLLINTLLGEIFGDLVEPIIRGNVQDFLNQRVVVKPTVEEIENATLLYTASNNLEDSCAICQDEITTNQEVRRLHHCSHYFHRDCIDVWFQENVHCPTCRHDIREVQENNRNMPPPVPENHRRTNINQT
jgi:hypothetical protein